MARRNFGGVRFKIGTDAGQGIVEARLEFRRRFVRKAFREFLAIAQCLLRQGSESLNAASDVFGAIAIGVQFFVPRGLGVRETRSGEFFGLLDVRLPALFDFPESGFHGLIELRRKSGVNGPICRDLDLALKCLKELLRGDHHAVGFSGDGILHLGFC